MVYNRRKRKYRRRRYPRRKYMKRYRKRSLRRSTRHNTFEMGIPDAQHVKLKYAFVGDYGNAVASGGSAIYFSGNGIWDPGLSDSNQKALGVDQWKNFYLRYRVAASKIIVHAHTHEAKATDVDENLANEQYFIGVQPTRSNVYGKDNFAEEVLQPYNKWAYLTSPLGSKSTAFIKHYMTTKKIFGLKTLGQRDDLAASMTDASGNNPSEEWYWTLKCTEGDGSTAASQATPVTLFVYISYYVTFFKRIRQEMGAN